MKRRLILGIIALLLATSGCGGKGTDSQDKCGTLVKICDGKETIIMRGVKDLTTSDFQGTIGDSTGDLTVADNLAVTGILSSEDDQVLYLRFWDCATEDWILGEISSDCTLKMR